MYEYFKKALDERNLKVAEFSRMSGISQSTLSDWKTGRSTPKADKMQKIAECLGVSVEYLMTGIDSSDFVMPKYDQREHDLLYSFGQLDDLEKDYISNCMHDLLMIQKKRLKEAGYGEIVSQINMNSIKREFDVLFIGLNAWFDDYIVPTKNAKSNLYEFSEDEFIHLRSKIDEIYCLIQNEIFSLFIDE